MEVLVTGICLLGAAFLVHLVVWRIRLPQNHTVALLRIFALTPMAAYLLAKPPVTWDILHAALFYGSCALVYVILYSSVEEESPTLTILTYMNAAPKGCVKEELEGLFADKHVLEGRVAAMVHSGLLAHNESGYTLTKKGYSLATLFAYAARVFGLKQGG
jgi:hypothetical protein